MDLIFEYENRDSMEKIMCYELGTEVSNRQEKFIFQYPLLPK